MSRQYPRHIDKTVETARDLAFHCARQGPLQSDGRGSASHSYFVHKLWPKGLSNRSEAPASHPLLSRQKLLHLGDPHQAKIYPVPQQFQRHCSQIAQSHKGGKLLKFY